MSDQGETIVAAGPLTGPMIDVPDDDETYDHLPSVAGGAGGKLRLVYLSRRRSQRTARLLWAELRLDAETGRPRLAPDAGASGVLSEGVATTPLLISADGSKVFGRDSSGRMATFALPGQTD
jgi:hypothetical protein